ncbi:MAG: O-antigen ligase family protein [bacterium]|nr:O-antigen ligase family protein [bacterium]
MLAPKLLYYSFLGVFFFLPIATAPGVIFAVLAILIWLGSGLFWKEKSRWLHQPWFIPAVILMLLPWLGLLYSENLPYGLKIAKKSYLWFTGFALASVTFTEKENPKKLISAFLIGLAFNASVSILQNMPFFKGWLELLPLHFDFPVGFLDLTGHITLSLFLVFGILLLSFYFQRVTTRTFQSIIIAGIVLYFIDLILVQGRTGYLAFLFLSPILFSNVFGEKRRKLILFCILIIFILFAIAPPVQKRIQEVVNEVKQFQAGNPETSIGHRLYFWKGAWKICLTHPIIGVGTGDYGLEMKRLQAANVLPPISIEITHAHNTFLHLAVSFGIWSVFVLCWLLGILLKTGLKYRHTEIGFMVLIFSLIYIIGSFTDTLIYRHQTLYLFALIVGLQSALNYSPKQET